MIARLNITGDREHEFQIKRGKLFGDSGKPLDGVMHDMSALDAKSSALLTHISIILVVIGFSLGRSGTYWLIETMLVLEMVLYTFVATLLLRSVDMMGPPFKPLALKKKAVLAEYYIEIQLRREIYSRSLRAAFVLTALLIPTFILKSII